MMLELKELMQELREPVGEVIGKCEHFLQRHKALKIFTIAVVLAFVFLTGTSAGYPIGQAIYYLTH